MTNRAWMAFLLVLSFWAAPSPAAAWDREHVRTFAVLPDGSGGPEGLEVDPDGNVYVASLGFSASGPLLGEGRIFVYDRKGHLLRTLTVKDSSRQLLGLLWRPATRTLLVVDFGNGRVLDVDPETGESSPFITFPVPAAESSPNDMTFDRAGNIYISDSFQGTIWRTDSGGGEATAWVANEPLLQTSGVPPFGANGLRFNRDETALFVANTGNDTIVRIPIDDGTPGAAEIFVNGINGADGLLVDDGGNLWVAANQADEIVVVDPTSRVIAKLGDFDGVKKGVPSGLLFPASIRFLGDRLLVTNLALDLRLFGLAPAVDSEWCADVTRYTVSILPARLERRADDDDEDRREGHHRR